jgi:hypothetical protein
MSPLPFLGVSSLMNCPAFEPGFFFGLNAVSGHKAIKSASWGAVVELQWQI